MQRDNLEKAYCLTEKCSRTDVALPHPNVLIVRSLYSSMTRTVIQTAQRSQRCFAACLVADAQRWASESDLQQENCLHLPFQMSLRALFILGFAIAQEAQATQPAGVVFENVRIFNGTSDQLSPPSNVLVVGDVIDKISDAPIAPPSGTAVTRIQGGGRTLMLLRGFTAARDMGGPVFGIKRAIHQGKSIGPRNYPSGAMISQSPVMVTSGCRRIAPVGSAVR